MNNTQLIIFDWDGTLMDSEGEILTCMRAAIEDLQLEPRTDNELKNIIGLGLQEALRTLYPQGSNAELLQLTARYRYHFLESPRQPSELFAGARTMVEELHKAGHFLAVATGKGRNGLNKVLEQTGLDDYFHTTRCADECHSKPHPQMLHEIMDYLGVEADRALMIGDTEYDLLMASNAGVKSLAVTYGVHERQRLLDCQPLECVDSIKQLHGWLKEKANLAA
ncbi:MAG: HAD-IA family hydrolase [Thiohalophilus sp.]|uniref:HAD-IA family hydrolase n=1 Tax=Thiohalophilus sp. TaxID=3028392 RepID=UPI0028700EA7|nr:HAD-IA family hydrolase [Thiohalophilus sp.]MDR9435524.1 HAD-IA family hydrolase [Thiohalophilus sp.]